MRNRRGAQGERASKGGRVEVTSKTHSGCDDELHGDDSRLTTDIVEQGISTKVIKIINNEAEAGAYLLRESFHRDICTTNEEAPIHSERTVKGR